MGVIERYYKWITATVVMMGTFMALLDTTIVDITLPRMMAELNTDTTGIQWVVISYLTASAIGMTAVGWLGSRINHKNTYILGLIIFITASALCGQAQNNEQMTLFRLIQGIGEGIVVPISMTILYEVFPEDERGLAMGIYGLGASFAPALGPTLGGYITEHLSWRWIFYINLPVGILALFLSVYVLKRHGEGQRKWSFDTIGFLLMSTMFSSLIIFTTKGQEKEWFASDFIVLMVAIFVISTVLFILRELIVHEPVVDLSLFRNRNFSLSILVMVFFSMNLYGTYFLMPLYLQNLKLYPTLLSGKILLPGALLTSLAIIIGGVLSDRYNPKYILTLGIVMMTVFTYRLSTFDLHTQKMTIIYDFALWNIGLGFVFPPATVLALAGLSGDRVNMGSSLMNVSRLIAGSIGTSIATTVLVRREELFTEELLRGIHPGNIAIYPAFEKISHFLLMRGALPGRIEDQTLSLVEGYTKALAVSYAFKSCYIWMASFPLVALFFIYFLRHKPGKKPLPQIH